VEKLQEFLESLLNRKIQGDELIRLSSAQTARFIMWAEKNNLVSNLSQIKQSFTLNSLSLPNLDSRVTELPKIMHKSVSRIEVLRLGNDIQLVSELFPSNQPLDLLELEKFFTKYEIAYSNSSSNPKATLTGLFSMKESLVKEGANYSSYLDLEITHEKNGAPIFDGFLVSISHSGDYVASVAMKIA
jgi:phosphopantetheinyl transferase (holo-ACP synthase)